MFVCFPLRPLRLLSAIVVCLVSVCTQLRAEQPDPALTLPDINYPVLRELLDRAMVQSPQMLTHNINLSRAEAGRISGNSRYLPSLSARGDYSFNTVSGAGSRSQNGEGFFYSVNLSQPLFRWGENAAEREITHLAERMAQKAYTEAYRDLAANIRSQFLRLIIMKRSLAVRASEIQGSEHALQETTTRQKAGVGALSEVVAAQTFLDDLLFAKEREQFEYEQSRHALSLLCGGPDLTDEQIPSEIVLPVIAENQALQLVTYFDQTDSVKELPSISITKAALRQSELRYKIASVRLLPKVEFGAATNQRNQTYISSSSFSQIATRETSAGIAVYWAIFDGFATRAAKMSTLADKRDAEQRLKTLLQGLDDQKRALVTRFNLAVRGMALLEGKNRRQHEALSEARDNARQGRVSSTVVEQFESYALQTELQAMSGRAEVYARWNELIGLLAMDPALQRLPAKYLSHGN